MYRIEEKPVVIHRKPDDIFNFLSDLRNFGRLLPPEVKDWQTDGKQCSFTVSRAGQFRLKIAEALPHSRLAYTSLDNRPFYYDINANIDSKGDSSEVTLYINAKMNSMYRMLASKPLKKLLSRVAKELKLLLERELV
jgi:carbon monoxide dehydrogenase subunit G